jgi:predicted small lipoprotein YifL
MKSNITNSKILALVAILIGFISFTGCGDSNPVKLSPDEVQGRYDFTEFIFTPDAEALIAANVLDTLVMDRSDLLLLDGGQFALSYQFQEGEESLIFGDFTVTESAVELKMSSGAEERQNDLLLHSPLRLTRNLETSSLATIEVKTKDLSLFSDRYAGIPPVEGELRIKLVLRE